MMSSSFDTIFNLDDPGLISVLDELPFWSAPFGIKLLEKIIPKKNMAVLDIGFGTGFPLTELAMRLGDTCRIYGIDPWDAAAGRAREKIRVYGIRNCELLTVAVQNIAPVETQNIASLRVPESIDLIVSNNGLNNVPDMGHSLSECARILKPGGQLAFTMNLDGTMMEFYDVMKSVLEDHHLPGAIESMKHHIYEKRKPLEEVLSLLEQHGFVNISADHDQFSYTFADGTTMFRHFFIRLGFLDAWKKIVPEDQQQVVFEEIETRINKISEKQGYFRLSVPFVVISAFAPRRSKKSYF